MTLAVGEATKVRYGPGAARLLTASPAGTIEQHALDIEDLFPAAARRVGRPLTEAEHDRFAVPRPALLDLDRYRSMPVT